MAVEQPVFVVVQASKVVVERVSVAEWVVVVVVFVVNGLTVVLTVEPALFVE